MADREGQQLARTIRAGQATIDQRSAFVCLGFVCAGLLIIAVVALLVHGLAGLGLEIIRLMIIAVATSEATSELERAAKGSPIVRAELV